MRSVIRRLRKQWRYARNGAGGAPEEVPFDGSGGAPGRYRLTLFNVAKRWPLDAAQARAPHAIRPSAIVAVPAA